MKETLLIFMAVVLVGCQGLTENNMWGDNQKRYRETMQFERPNVKLHAPPLDNTLPDHLQWYHSGVHYQGNAMNVHYADWHNERQWEKINELEARIDLLLKKIEADCQD